MDIPTFHDIFAQIRNNFNLCGIPFECKKPVSKKFFLLLLILLTVLLEQIAYFFTKMSTDNFLELTQIAPCVGVGILAVLKICSMAYKKTKIVKLSESLNDLYSTVQREMRYRKIVKNDMNTLKLFTKYYLLLNKMVISIYLMLPFIIAAYDVLVKKEVKLNLPFAVIVPFSTEPLFNWIVVYIQLIIAGFLSVTFYSTVDALYCVLCCHVCNNFTVLCHDIQNLEVADDIETLKDFIKRHQLLLKLSEDLENIFNLANLFNVLVGSIEICALGFNLTMGDWSQIPGCTLFLSSVLLRIFMMSVFGEKIVSESTRIGDSAYSSKWYNMKLKSKKIMLILMTRSHKPQRLTAYKFSIITYETFTKIISTSWTYFTILQTVYNPVEEVH